MRISVHKFTGMSPKVDGHLLSNEQSELAINTRTDSGTLSCWKDDAPVKELSEGSVIFRSLFLYDRPTSGDRQWLFWEDNTKAVKGPVYNDKFNRIFMTSETGNPRCWDENVLPADASTADDTNTYPLGLPTPNAPLMALEGEPPAEVKDSRSYVVTYMRVWDANTKLDESINGLPGRTADDKIYIDVDFDSVVKLSKIKNPMTDRPDVNHIAIYRSATGSELTKYQFVTEFDITEAKTGTVTDVTYDSSADEFTFLDKVKAEDLGETLTTTTWTPPKEALRGLTSLNNGILAGHTDNDVYLSEPYQPHAWPEAYRITVDYKIVGLGSFGNYLVILTEQGPLIASVSQPANVYVQPMNLKAPCLSARSISSTNNAVIYAGPNGLISVSTQGCTNITEPALRKEQWAMLEPDTMVTTFYEDKIFCVYEPKDAPKAAFLLNPKEPLSAYTILDVAPDAFYVDYTTESLYYLATLAGEPYALYLWEGEDRSRKTYTWKSKVFTSPQGPTNCGAAQVYSYPPTPEEVAEMERLKKEYEDAFDSAKLNGAFNTTPVNEHPYNGDAFSQLRMLIKELSFITFSYVVDGVVVYERQVKDNKPFRLPSGFVGTEFQFILTGTRPVYGVDIAASLRELSSIITSGANYAMQTAIA